MDPIRTLALGCDHAGFDYKQLVIDELMQQGIAILDKGTFSNESADYPDFIHPVARAIERGQAQSGIILCGSGNGAAMTANKHKGIRAALCWTKELAELARQHNDANVLSIPVRFVSEACALDMIRAFLKTEFEGGRHARRVNKISDETSINLQ